MVYPKKNWLVAGFIGLLLTLALGCGVDPLAYSSTSSSLLVEALHPISCKRQTTRFRQYCVVDESPLEISTSLANQVDHQIQVSPTNDGPTSELNLHFDLQEVLENRRVVDYTLEGLQPRLQFTLDWTDSQECWQNGMHYDKIVVEAQQTGAETFVEVGRVRVGAFNYDLPLVVGGLPLFTVSHQRTNQTGFETQFRLHDAGRDPQAALPSARIPLNCQMTMTNITIGFSPQAIFKDARMLESAAWDKDDLLRKATVLHGFFVEGQKGALCSIVAERRLVRLAAGFGPLDEDSSLPLPYRNALNKTIEEAVQLGAIDRQEIPNSEEIGLDGVPLKDYWRYYAQNIDAIQQECEEGRAIYPVSTEPFVSDNGEVLHHAGYSNAKDYFRYVDELKQIMAAGWSLTKASYRTCEESQELNWLINPEILFKLGEE